MIHRFSIRFIVVTLVLCESISAVAQDKRSEHADFFESKIRPALVKHCYECHSAEADSVESGLALDTHEGLARGGDRGSPIVPGRPDESLLFKAISHSDPDLHMPPGDEQLAESTIADFRRWIEAGALDPRSSETPTQNRLAKRNTAPHWAYQSRGRSHPPAVHDSPWPVGPIDAFIFEKLKSQSLTPSPDAEPSVLLRRLHFDLIGLPPSPQQNKEFVQRIAARGFSQALAVEVDRLLALPEFSERWGRHWLDVARYAESSGKESNLTFPHAWRYRDYVFDAFNADKPYSRFIMEQIAGDLVPYENASQRAELLIATGFLAIGPKSLNEMDPRQFQADLVDEQIDSISRAVLATSIACARCHDHKSDPFSMEDYYALAGIFYSTDTRFGSSIGPESQINSRFVQLPSLPDQVIPNQSIGRAELEKLLRRVQDLKWEKRRRQAQAVFAPWIGREPGEFFSLQDAIRILWSLGGLDATLKTVDDQGNALPLAMGVVEHTAPRNVPLLKRGEISMPGEMISRRFPVSLSLPETSQIPEGQSGRLELANWLTDPAHPLTARVMVNRIWRHLFGDGLVQTVDNFGSDGQEPSHPELLDYLSDRFIDRNWSIKSMVREMVLTRTYRQTSAFDEQAFERDPENRLLWRMSKRRLDAEAIRDAALCIAQRLELDRPRSSLVAQIGNRPVAIIGFDNRVAKDLDGSRHRSAYLPVIRDRLPDAIDLFDGAEPSLVTGRRETTNVPLQSLFLMNSSFVQQQAEALAERLASESSEHDERIGYAFELCFNREPSDDERQIAMVYLGHSPDAFTWMQYCQSLLSTAEFRSLD